MIHNFLKILNIKFSCSLGQIKERCWSLITFSTFVGALYSIRRGIGNFPVPITVIIICEHLILFTSSQPDKKARKDVLRSSSGLRFDDHETMGFTMESSYQMSCLKFICLISILVFTDRCNYTD